MSERRLLLISYLFPPAGGIGVQRALSLARYLPRYGYRVHVLSARNPATPVMDPDLLRRLPPEVSLHRAFTPEIPFHVRQKLWRWIARPREDPAGAATGTQGQRAGWATGAIRRLLSPDPEVVWRPFAYRAAHALIRRHRIETVLVTAPPFSAFLTGVALKRAFPEIQLVSDFRDSWLNFYLSTFDFLQGDSMRRRSTEMERRTVAASDLVVAVTPSIREELAARYPDQPASKFACVLNGYDPEAFAGFRARPHGVSRVVVTYVGTVYTASSPRYYFRALESLPEAVRARFETRFIGRVTPEERPLLDRPGVRELGFLPQAEAFRHLEETDYVLLVMTDAASVTGKIFEYLATGKPILAFSPPGGEVTRILEQTGGGWCVDPQDLAGARKMLEEAAARAGTASIQPDREAIGRFDRSRLAGEYAALIEDRRPKAGR